MRSNVERALREAMEIVSDKLNAPIHHNTCEVCDEHDLAKCRSCALSGEPNPEAFNREELILALVLEARIKEVLIQYHKL